MLFPVDDDGGTDPRLLRLCSEAHLDVQVMPRMPTLDGVADMLPSEPHLLLLPAVSTDCAGIKFLQIARGVSELHRVHLYAHTLPDPAYLAQAVRSGVGEVLVLEDDDALLTVQLRRAFKGARDHWQDGARAAAHVAAMAELRMQLAAALQQADHLRDRGVAIAATAMRIASVSAALAKARSKLLIVLESDTRAARVEEIATELHFEVMRASTGAQGIASVDQWVPAVVVCDGELADMDASSFALSMRKQLGSHPLCVIVWSSEPGAEKLLAPGTGLDDLVPKSAGDIRTQIGGALLAALG